MEVEVEKTEEEPVSLASQQKSQVLQKLDANVSSGRGKLNGFNKRLTGPKNPVQS